ncbi:hypothetical protein NIES4102_12450 [Chondrocystis sp. NIES-4102]|nr:hypothetical protein NIES4102_12450 [Chondrocystis sp. NIES-4102]
MSKANLAKISNDSPNQNDFTQVRLQIFFPNYYQQPLLSLLTSNCAVAFNVTKSRLDSDYEFRGQLDLELRGTIPQICCGLAYLESLDLKIIGKANSDRDSWYY